MKKRIVLLTIFAAATLFFSQDIKEYVQVNWRIIPLYAVDKDENPILDLSQKDITLTVAGKEVRQFVLYGRNFQVAEETTVAEAQATPALPPKKMLFFVFDVALTDPLNIEHAKKIASEIIVASDVNSSYLLLTIDPEKGLVFYGNSSEKSKALELLSARIKRKNNSRSFNVFETYSEEIEPIDTWGMSTMGMEKGAMGGNKFETQEIVWLLWLRSIKYRRKCELFFDSFKSLYYSIRTLTMSKVVFLFSQGVSSTFQSLMFDRDLNYYRGQLSEMANFLNKSGAVLFVVNPAMADNEAGDSGKESLRYLAAVSGGKYLAGTKKNIVKKVVNMNRAYYELAFAEDEPLKGNAPRVEVKVSQRGVRIYSVNHIERRKTLAEMNTLEREMVVVNLVNNNPFVRMEMKVFRLAVSKVTESDSLCTFSILTPPELQNHSIELYKIWRSAGGNVEKMEPIAFTPAATENKVEIARKKLRGKSSVRLVLLDITGNQAWVQYGEASNGATTGTSLQKK